MRSPVVVWRTKFVKGYNGGEVPNDLEKHPVMDIADALFEDFDTDAHFVPYAVSDSDGKLVRPCPRLNKDGLADLEANGYSLAFYAAVIDVDCPTADKSQQGEASAEWRQAQSRNLSGVVAELVEGMARYDTRGGYRLVWRLPKPLAADRYLHTISEIRNELAEHDITADPLTDWTRCYRLPSVVRDKVEQCWDASLANLGNLIWKPTPREATAGNPFAGIESIKEGFTLLEGERIGEGGRNSTMMRMAGALRRAGLTEHDILEQLQRTNDERCDPPLPERDLIHMSRYVCGKSPLEDTVPQYPEIVNDDGTTKRSTLPMTQSAEGVPIRFPSNSETILARGAGEDLEGLEAMIATQGLLWRCDDKTNLWSSLDDQTVFAQVTAYDGDPFVSGYKKGQPTLGKLNISSTKASGAVRILKAERHQKEFFERAPRGVAFQTSFVRLADWELIEEPLEANHRQQYGLTYPYEEQAIPAAFIEFLRSCWSLESDCDEMIQAFRKWLGAALLAEAPRYQKAVVMIGDGANGKSTLQEICKALFPPETVTSIPPQDMDNEYRRAMLAPSRLNIVAEMPEADILTGEAVKAMISGDTVTARHIRQAPFQFKPKAAHLFSANSLPSVRDMSPGFWRRWMVFPFKRCFAEHEQDRTLAKRVIAEDLPAIASWAIAGVAELAYRGRFDEPATCTEAKTRWRRNVDSVASFMDAKCAPDDEGTTSSMLYSEFVEWTNEVGLHKMSQRKFGERLRLLGVQPKKKNGCVVYPLATNTGAAGYVN